MRQMTRGIPLGAMTVVVGLVISPHAQSATQSAPAHRVPLRPGLTIVTALYEPDSGDYESIKTITEANDARVRLIYSAEIAESPNPFSGSAGAAKPTGAHVKRFSVSRVMSRPDLENATQYRCLYSEIHPESFPGSTAVGVSRRVLTNLETKGESPLEVCSMGMMGGLASLVNGLLGKNSPAAGMDMLSGTIKRVEPRAIPFKVLVNDTPAEVPVVHARGKFGSTDGEFWILDDPDNPLAMKWQVGDDHLQVIRLAFPIVAETAADGRGGPLPSGRGAASGSGGSAGAGGAAGAAAGGGTGGGAGGAGAGGNGTGSAGGGASAGADPAAAKRIETDLAKTGRTIVYGIYFDFASDQIKKESEPVLAEIAQVMKQNATWNISVEGHTDNIGGDAYNLDLSQRRAAAVKQALVNRYHIDERRMQTAGFGMRVPKDRNDTIEGRARNRRVELVKRD